MFSKCPGNMTIKLSATEANRSVAWPALEFHDNAELAPLQGPTSWPTKGLVNGSVLAPGTYRFAYTAVDLSGNSVACSFYVSVLDLQPPTFEGCPSNKTVDIPWNASTAAVSWVEPACDDNVDGPVFLADPLIQPYSQYTGTAANHSNLSVGVATVTYTANDTAGNMGTCMFLIDVKDVTPPVWSHCSPNVDAFVANSSNGTTVTWQEGAAKDAVDGNIGATKITLQTHPTPHLRKGSMFPVGTTRMVYRAPDRASNVATCSFNVTVHDRVPPRLTRCPPDKTQPLPADQKAVTLSWPRPLAEDAVDGQSSTH